MPKTTLKLIDRSTNGLRAALVDEWDSLRRGKSTPQKAKAVASLAAQVVGLTRVELDFMKMMGATKGANGATVCLPSLNLTSAK